MESFETYRAYLFAIAYRMLGSVMDAEDLVQETFLRWQQASLATIRSPKAFLSTVVRNLCLNHLQSARVRREECSDSPSLESSLAEPSIDPAGEELLADSLTAAFLVLLERLSPKERAVFLLREVFDCEYDEIAEIIRKNAVTCRQMLRRAKQHIRLEESRFVASPEQLETLIRQFTNTCATGDLQSFVLALA